MDERNPRTSVAIASSGTELAHAAVPSDQPNHQPVNADADSTVVYYGDAESVRAGFSLALSLMQASSDLFTPDAAPPAGNLIQEDN